ncbi:MAG: MBL fold metallo-hydrolase [Bacteroidota bacterium]|nr:MBL fold metallo-hydrolase [Bacteroidota bacterium]MDP4215474.1 MBL fold metallo-hydrolase [Bacteroidota bacterium]MDP4254972.1 MBL fold metallo-hydrolase [Bacteroidota bacterium]
MALLSVLGKVPAGKRLERVKRSPHYAGGSFRNLMPTELIVKGVSYLNMMRDYRNRPAGTTPPGPLPFVCTDLFSLPADRPSVVWFGHSSYLMKVEGVHILVDPVFGGNASPLSFFARSFPGTDVYTPDEFPVIDALIITHDHYDHLDYRSIRQFAPKIRHVYTSLGVGAHLEYWGIDPSGITELDWDDGARIADDLFLTAKPARHFSGRTFKRNQTLWSSFVLRAGPWSFFLGGDSGYGDHFQTIGEQCGPFDLAILECGQYGKNWPQIHMFPDQTLLAASALRAKTLLPVHWGKFSLSLHDWDEPIRTLVAAAADKGVDITTPMIGEPLIIGHEIPRTKWWEQV